MSDTKESVELILADLFRKLFPIEWMRRKMYFPDDIYATIPLLVYRYKDGCDEKYQSKLAECIDSFNGKQQWVVFRHFNTRRKNYILTLKIVYDAMKNCEREGRIYKEKEEFRDCFNQICEEAITDIPELAEHIKQCINET
ncbi:hypothetical protein [Clostridium sp. AN503]|uniref:hypothetical protein n=1 Tax=Clostridium sp. AN503 TaxID=3160598 RepID=UPI00345794B8